MALVEWTQLSVSIALVVATVAYAYFVKQSVEVESKPHLQAFVDYAGRGNLYFRVRNTGNGAAHSVSAEWAISTDGIESEQRTWQHGLIPPGHEHKFRIPLGPVGEGKTSVDTIRGCIETSDGSLGECTILVHLRCRDILHRQRTFCHDVDVARKLRQGDEAEVVGEMEAVESIETDIGLIRHYLENMN